MFFMFMYIMVYFFFLSLTFEATYWQCFGAAPAECLGITQSGAYRGGAQVSCAHSMPSLKEPSPPSAQPVLSEECSESGTSAVVKLSRVYILFVFLSVQCMALCCILCPEEQSCVLFLYITVFENFIK